MSTITTKDSVQIFSWTAQPASLFAGHATETLRYAGLTWTWWRWR
jgi:hypothetical protein